MAWYEYTTWKSNIGAITADVRGLLAKRRARRDEAIKAEMRAEIVKAVGEIVKPISQIIDLLGKHLDQQDRRFAEIEKKLGISTEDHALADMPISEKNRRQLDALLGRSTPPAAPLGFGSMAPRSNHDNAMRVERRNAMAPDEGNRETEHRRRNTA